MDSYRLYSAQPGDTLTFTNPKGEVFTLAKNANIESGLQGWELTKHPERFSYLGGRVIDLTLLEPNKNGTPFRLNREVAQPGDIIGAKPRRVSEEEPYEPCYELGTVAALLYSEPTAQILTAETVRPAA